MSVQSDDVSGHIDTGPAITSSCLPKEKATLISVLKHCILTHLLPDYGCEARHFCIYFNTQILLLQCKILYSHAYQ